MILSVSGHNFSAEPRDRREAVLAGGDNRGRGAVAEQSGGDDRGGIVAVEPDGDRAGLDGDEQPVRAGLGRGEARGGGEAVDSAGAAEAEDRHAADVVAEAEPRADARFEAGRGDAGGRNGDDAVDLVGRQAGLRDGRRRPLRRTSCRSLQIDRVAFVPSHGLPSYQSCGATMWRLAMPALSNTRRQPIEQRFLPPKDSRAEAFASSCSMTCGGTAVASESRLQGRMQGLIQCAVRTGRRLMTVEEFG